MRVVLVYLQQFRRRSLLKCVSQPKIAKNSLKPLFKGFEVVQGHRCWYPGKLVSSCDRRTDRRTAEYSTTCCRA